MTSDEAQALKEGRTVARCRMSPVETEARRVTRRMRLFLLVALTSCRLFDSGNDGDRRPCWVSRHTGWSSSRPAVDGTLVFVADGTGRVRALEQATGREIWSTLADPTGRMVGSNLLVDAGVLVALGAFQAVGVDASTGDVKWRFEPPLDSLYPQPPPRPGYMGRSRMDTDGLNVFIPAWGASISAVDLQTGQARWVWGSSHASGFRSGSNGVRVHGDTVYATAWHYVNPLGGLSEIWLLALDRNDGRELWRKAFQPYTSGLSVEGSPVVYGIW